MMSVWLLLAACTGFAIIAGFLADGLRLLLERHYRAYRMRQSRTPRELVVLERQDFSEDLFGVTLADPRGARLPAFRPGQYVSVLLNTEPDRCIQRCYSLAAWEKRPRQYQLAIRRVPNGLVSNRLHRQLEPGRRIRLLPPRGHFTLDSRRDDVVLIAGGIGITPLRAMLHACLENKRHGGSRITLFYAARHEYELCYHRELSAAAKTHCRFSYYPILSRPGAAWDGMTGRLDVAGVLARIDKPQQSDFYICAGMGMTGAFADGLREQGVCAGRIHSEMFSPAHGLGDENTYQVHFENHEPFLFGGQPTLLHGLEQAGIKVDSDCRTGRCGICRIKLREGRCRWLITPEIPLANNEILACCTLPQSNLQLAQ